MKIYTRTGDEGATSLLDGTRVPKNDARIDAYGTVDELNSQLGVVRALWPDSPVDALLAHAQNDLFDLGAQLASPDARFGRVGPDRVAALETEIDSMESELEPLRNFILPGGSLAAAQLHVARTVCRRAERLVVGIPDSHDAIRYLNRLSDVLFVAARFANHRHGIPDVLWKRGTNDG
jgi:cob(I)alamin adenosyltransferase